MAETIAFHILAKDAKGNVVFERYVHPDQARQVARPLQDELFDVTVEPVTELPEGVELQ
mgnify:CR=1 FL=1